MKTLLFVPALMIMLLVRTVSHTLELLWPVRPVRAVANGSAKVLKGLIYDKTKSHHGEVLGHVSH